jgi:uncharacterized protein (DUF952 family)
VRIFHLTTSGEWAAAQRTGRYTVSTHGRSLDEEGFIHCSYADQVDGTRSTFFAEVPDVVLLEVETDLLSSPWREEPVGDGGQRFPHVYGPLDLEAVVAVSAR